MMNSFQHVVLWCPLKVNYLTPSVVQYFKAVTVTPSSVRLDFTSRVIRYQIRHREVTESRYISTKNTKKGARGGIA